MTQTVSKRMLKSDRIGKLATFTITYETLATLSARRRIYQAILGCAKFKAWAAEELISADDLHGFAMLLAHTVDIQLSDEARDIDHPELNTLQAFWTWWLGERGKSVIDADALIEWRVTGLGFWTMRAWDEAFGKAQVPELSAPRELLPDAALIDEERDDPS